MRFGETGDLLWLACVGITDAYLHARLDVAGYSQFAIFLRDCCQRLFPNDMYHRVGSSVYAEHLTNGGNSGTNNHENSSSSTRTKISFSATGRILSESDFRFFLLRHSSLLDGMRYSEYCASKLGNHNAALPRIHELLAKIGYPLTECQQPYALMKPSFRQRLRDRIREFAPEYGLDNLEFTSFFRVTGYNSLLSASDTTYAVTALLEALDMGGDDGMDEEDRLLESFHRAYEALNSYASTPSTVSLHAANLTSLVNGAGGGGGLTAGLRLAMARQRAILSTASSLVERNAIVRLSHFRYAYVTSNMPHGGDDDWRPSSEQDGGPSRSLEDILFAQPLALLRLAHYLMDLHRENGKWTGSRARPLVLVASRDTDTYLVAGYEFSEEPGTVVPNTFGKHFELAAQSMQGTFKFDSFDSNVVEVGAKDVQRFIEQLHYLLDSV
jgi:cell division control protein 45